jgi:hypothetical protein
MWGNSTWGDCVSAEEASAKDADGSVKLADQTVTSWASAHGFLNGAMLTDVMDAMAKDGMQQGGNTYGDGPYNSVNWTDWPTLTSAIAQGQVKIGVAAAQLQNVVGGANGWFLGSAYKDGNIDHCVGLAGYGTVADCAKALNVAVPANSNPNDNAVILFTWSTYGIVTLPALVAITGEAWLRNPTSIVTPAPTPGPTPTPPSPTPAPRPCPRLRAAIANDPALARELVELTREHFPEYML